MYVTTLDCKESATGIEVLELKLTLGTAVNGISPVATEQGNIEVVRTTADLLIGVERDTNLSVLNLGMSLQILDSRNDFGNRLSAGSSRNKARQGAHSL